jgi:hypothetical protein
MIFKLYQGQVVDGKKRVFIRQSPHMQKVELLPYESRNIYDLSCDFDWATNSEGSKQLALAILNEVYGAEFASRLYTQFALEVLMPLQTTWALSTYDIKRWREELDYN